MKKAFTLICTGFLLSGLLVAQEKTTLSLKDLDSGIEKYIKKNYEDYKAVEAFNYGVIFETKALKGDASDWLLFDAKGKFLKQESETERDAMTLQVRTTLAVKDAPGDITSYAKKNDYKLSECYMYDEAYEVKIMKGNDSQTLLFDKDGNFVKTVIAPTPPEKPATQDSVPAKSEDEKK